MAGYSEGGRIEGCVNNGNLEAIGTDWGGAAYAGGMCGDGHKTNATMLSGNENNGSLSATAYDNSNWFGGCDCKTSDEIAHKEDFAA